jgi:prepilin-type N-terminal cleavage/methylation domain-containing protein
MISKKAFTLIEVLVSISILVVISMYLLKINIDSKTNYHKLKDKNTWEDITTSIIIYKKDYIDTTNLYEYLKSKYVIKSFEVRQSLKNIKFQQKINKFSTIQISHEAPYYIGINKIDTYNKNINSNTYNIELVAK